MDLPALVKDLGLEEKFHCALGVVMLLQEFSASSHIPVWHNGTFIGWVTLP